MSIFQYSSHFWIVFIRFSFHSLWVISWITFFILILILVQGSILSPVKAQATPVEDQPMSRQDNSIELPSYGELKHWDSEPNRKKLINDTLQLTALSGGILATIYLLPESYTNWDRDIKPSFSQWKENITTPVIDKDDFTLNYIGHPYFGATYVMIAKRAGYSDWQALHYSFWASFTYEAIESFAEEISIQDLFVTPLGGYLFYKGFTYLDHRIIKNKGKLLGSKFLARFIRIMNPLHAVDFPQYLKKKYKDLTRAELVRTHGEQAILDSQWDREENLHLGFRISRHPTTTTHCLSYRLQKCPKEPLWNLALQIKW